jgi:hypothetical protein
MGLVEGITNRFRWSGDVRVRYENFSQDGTEARHRERIRLRLGLEGKLNEDFSGGIYMASGAWANGAPSYADPVSTNETLTGFFERKSIGFDRGWITYNPGYAKWLSVTGGKFAPTWNKTPLTFDNDLNTEGFSQKVTWKTANPVVCEFSASAFQLLYNESGGGADSYAFGGQLASKLQLGSKVSITPSWSILNWQNEDVIAQAANPAPRPSNTPARIINGNGLTNSTIIRNPGTSSATRAFASKFVYSDFIVQSDVKWNDRFPLKLLFEFEQNLEAANDQDKAFWTEIGLGQNKVKKDFSFGYGFARIEQDAVISQFNESDMRQATNVLQHRVFATYNLADNTTLGWTTWMGRALDESLAGLAAQEPYLKRTQIDLVYKF